jgi:hypothetical protein
VTHDFPVHDKFVIDHHTAGSTGLAVSGDGDIWQSAPALTAKLSDPLSSFLFSTHLAAAATSK